MNNIRYTTNFIFNHFQYKHFKHKSVRALPGKKVNSQKIATVQSSSFVILAFAVVVGVLKSDLLFGKVKSPETLKEVNPKTQENRRTNQKDVNTYPVKGYICPESDEASAYGNDYFWSSPKILVPEKVNKFVIAHELAHIKHNHAAKYYASTLAYMVLYSQLSPAITTSAYIPAGLVAFTTFIALQTLLGRYLEKQADLTAALHVSSRSIAKYIGSLCRTRSGHSIYREIGNDWKTNLQITKNGDIFLYFKTFPFIIDPHPTFSERIRYLSEIVYSRENEEPIPLTVSIRSENDQEIQKMTVSPEITKEIRRRIKQSSRSDLWINLDYLAIYPNKALVFCDKNGAVFHQIALNSQKIDQETILKIVTEILARPQAYFLPMDRKEKEYEEKMEIIKKMENSGYVMDHLQKNDDIFIVRAEKIDDDI